MLIIHLSRTIHKSSAAQMNRPTLGAVEQNSNTTTNTVKHQTYVLVMSWSNEYRSLLNTRESWGKTGTSRNAWSRMHGLAL